ncbi:ZPR1 zinc-finger domain-containing protein [Pyronema omphalodes]|nr:ZPR1 zinc-finger domain-containing protein [Pyronema omphalodes]
MPHAEEEKKEEFFRPVGEMVEDVAAEGDDEPQIMDNIESLCMNCHEQGMTRLLLTQIPFFREVVLMSFECPHCHFKNCEIQSASVIQERGVSYSLKVSSKDDMDRQVVKADTCTARFEELDLEIPPQRGQLTTVEGLLTTVLEDISAGQETRKSMEPEAYEQIEAFIAKVRGYLEGDKFPFTLTVDDVAGNSWIEPRPGDARGKWSRKDYERTPEQNERLGLTDTSASDPQPLDDDPIRPDEVHTFPATCPSCVRPCNTHMKLVDIPHFKEVVIMSTVCDSCGYKSNEVKTGGAVPSKGRIITLRVEDEEDLARDILKSETCGLSCPEINLDLTPGTLGGRFTTVEGLLQQVHDELHQRIFTGNGEVSDSITPEAKERWIKFFNGLQDAKSGKIKFTMILDDPLAASYVQNLCAPDPDPQITIEDVERTKEQEEDLGLSDMVLEGYESGEERDKAAREAAAEEEKKEEVAGVEA